MIRAVIFDCFGVLTTDTWKAFIDSLPQDVDKDELRQLNRQLDAGFLPKDDFLRQVQDLTGRNPDQVEATINHEATKNKPLLQLVKQLKESGYKTAILSNISTNWVREAFLTQEEQMLFDEMIFSFEVHMTKPDPRIFELACERLGVDPTQTIFIDDIVQYCEAAKTLGINSLAYENLDSVMKPLETLINSKAEMA